ncbi:MAG: metal-dependent transcriptional regulator [Bacteroidales bacterium]|nr:metal-dependent transcriptional regulator [Bacteroidales bacterium]MCF8338148.1 metal-dependent transcriptional regulator [Bacteroidales bacterium]
MSIATENFLKEIYQLSQTPGGETKPGVVAEKLGISNAAATDMARNLAAKGLIIYEKYKELRLTSKGQNLALALLRKHRLWETFLYRTLDINLSQIHNEAELLEHSTSDFLVDKINSYLGEPAFDPHGDPIPRPDGKIPDTDKLIRLSTAKQGQNYHVRRLSGSEDEFFEFCRDNSIEIGQSIEVEKHYPSQNSIAVKILGQRILLNNELAGKIYVEIKI